MPSPIAPSDQFIPDGGNTPPVAPDPRFSLTGGQNFLPSGAVTGGQAAQNYGSDTPVNQDDSQVTPEEQKQYDDFVTRALLFINDPRLPLGKKGQPQPNGKAPRDVIIEHLNAVGGDAAEKAVGRTAAQVITLLTNNAKQQGYPYSPDVIFHGADEIITTLYKIGITSGVIQKAPPEDSPEEDHLLGAAKLFAAQFFGQNMINTGQNPPELQQQAQQYMLQNIQREGDSGGLDHWTPAQKMSPQQLTQILHKAASGELQPARRGPPTTISDYASLGHPRLVPQGGPAQAPPQGWPPPDQGGPQ